MLTRIAVLLTCYNRYEKTIKCLESIYKQAIPPAATFDIYLVDDQSPDHTGRRVKEKYPSITVINGTGSLFWVGGMRLCWSEAGKKDYDGYLLLNDDVLLYPETFKKLFAAHQLALTKYNKAGIYIGSTEDPETKKISYGGRKLLNTANGKSELIVPDETEIKECDFGHANILLVAKQVVQEIDILSPAYTHRLADYDYTLTAMKKGFPLLVCPGACGSCEDDHGQNWLSSNTTLKQRISYLKSPKHLAYSEYLHFIKKHFPLSLPASFIKLWLKTLFPFIWDKLKK